MDADQRTRIEALVGARLASAADMALARLIEHSRAGVHLICDHSHKLLALSATRCREFGTCADALIGRSCGGSRQRSWCAVRKRFRPPAGMTLQHPQQSSPRPAPTARAWSRLRQASVGGRNSCCQTAPPFGWWRRSADLRCAYLMRCRDVSSCRTPAPIKVKRSWA